MSDIAIVYAILAAAVVLFVSNRVPVELVAIGVSLGLLATGILDVDQALSGLGDPTVIFIASLFVVSEGLDGTGVTTWAGQRLLASVGTSRTRLIVLMMLLVALLTALISVNGAVAALIPVIVVIAMRLGRAPSQLLLPLAFGAHAGSMLALTGTPVNIIVSDAAAGVGGDAFGFFEFTIVGVPLLVGAITIAVLFGAELLPDRVASDLPSDLSQFAATVRDQYDIEPVISDRYGVAEVVVAPRSPLAGLSVAPGMLTPSGALVILAVQRSGYDLGDEPTILAVGDSLLVQGTWDDLEENAIQGRDILLVDPPDLIRRQSVPFGRGARRAVAVMLLMVVLLATGVVAPAVAGLLAASAMVLLGVVRVEQAYRSISWTTVILVGGMIPLSQAMEQTGAAEQLADGLLRIVGDGSPYVLMAGLFALTAALGQLISNTATALVLVPIAISAAAELEISERPLLMAVGVAAAASFLTPVATPANLMVMGPGAYRFGDYWKLGLVMMAWFFVVVMVVVPLVWRF